MMKKFIFSIAAMMIMFAAFAQTEGSDCSNPSTIASLPYSAASQTTMGTSPYTFPNYTMRSGCHVYKFIPTEDLNATITLSGISRAYNPEPSFAMTASNVGIFLYNGCPDAENAQLIGTPFVSSSTTSASGSISNVSLTASTEYYIVVAADSLISQGIFGYGAAASYTTASYTLSIERVVEHDVAVRTVTAVAAGCAASTDVSYTIANAGTLGTNENEVTVVCKVNGVDAATETLPAIASGATLTRTFANVALEEGNNTIQIIATLEGDETTDNNTGSTTVNRNSIVSSFPFSEEFESAPFGWTPSAANAWTVRETEGGNHYYMTDTAVSKNSYIYGPCFSFASLEMPELHFDVIADYPSSSGLGDIFGGMGDLFGGMTNYGFVLVSANNGTSWDTVANIDACDTWVSKNISLARYAGESNIQIRFVYNAALSGLGGLFGGTTTGGAGISLDNIVVKDAAEKDLGVIAITGPASGCGLSNSAHVSITIKNYGRQAQSGYVVKYSIDGGLNWVEETVNTEIAASATANYTFTAAMSMPGYGRYEIIAKTALVDDEDATNDEAEGFVVSQGNYSNAQVLFDDYEYEANFINDWYGDGTYSSWAFGKSQVQGTDSVWTWATNPNGPVNPGEESYLYSPCYDLSGLTNPIVKIGIMYNLSSMDLGDTGDTGMGDLDPTSMFGIFGASLSLQYSLNGGSAWANVVAGELNEGWYTANAMTEGMSNPGWSGNTNGFVSVKTSLSFPSAANLTNVRFRFAFKTTNMNMGDDETGMGGFFGDIFGSMTGGNSIKGAAINSFVVYSCGTPLPSASFTYSEELCVGQQIQFTNTSENADSYAWNFGDGTGLNLGDLTGEGGFDLGQFFGDGSTTSTEENPTMTYNAAGDYTVTLTATNECGTSMHQETLTINSCTDIEEVEAGISIYPNPASRNITILNAENANIEIINSLGQVVYTYNNISNEHSIDISNLPDGTYFVKVNETVSKVNIVR
ncbi:MAG: T9SS type A sorting domain-containing protein [Bacteroidales bacterium]|nr:T9SS type A sorting domain-containing protein [Bacteroidales bacterium]